MPALDSRATYLAPSRRRHTSSSCARAPHDPEHSTRTEKAPCPRVFGILDDGGPDVKSLVGSIPSDRFGVRRRCPARRSTGL